MLKRIVLFLALVPPSWRAASAGTTSTSGTGASAAPIDSGAASASVR